MGQTPPKDEASTNPENETARINCEKPKITTELCLPKSRSRIKKPKHGDPAMNLSKIGPKYHYVLPRSRKICACAHFFWKPGIKNKDWSLRSGDMPRAITEPGYLAGSLCRKNTSLPGSPDTKNKPRRQQRGKREIQCAARKRVRCLAQIADYVWTNEAAEVSD
jgi:hypothetical protein